MVNYENGKVWVFSFPLTKKNEAFARDILIRTNNLQYCFKQLAQSANVVHCWKKYFLRNSGQPKHQPEFAH
jgi:hypothetical protein